MKIELLVGRYRRMIGLARYTSSLQTHLKKAGVAFDTLEAGYPFLLKAAHEVLRPFGYDVRTFFDIFPASATFSSQAVKHLTTQMMASLYTFQPGLRKVVITVHDIVPYMMRDDPQQNVYKHFYDRLVDERTMRNIRRADRVIAISAFTQRMLVEKLDCPPENIRVVLYGLDHDLFRPVPPTQEFRDRYGLPPGLRYLVYVGSENPRKNLPRLVQAFEQVVRKFPQTRLLKVGTPEYLSHYDLLREQIRAAGLEEHVIFINHPPQEDLVAFYSIADAFVFPSLFEGFGMPPLEAMACGAPVICSNASSLPEVVGNAAILVDPQDVDGWAKAIVRVLEDEALQRELKSQSLARAAEFTWERAIRETLAVYQEVDRCS